MLNAHLNILLLSIQIFIYKNLNCFTRLATYVFAITVTRYECIKLCVLYTRLSQDSIHSTFVGHNYIV
jgi:hypothetical protein